MTSTSGGLLTSITCPQGETYGVDYDSLGEVTQNSEPLGGGWTDTLTQMGLLGDSSYELNEPCTNSLGDTLFSRHEPSANRKHSGFPSSRGTKHYRGTELEKLKRRRNASVSRTVPPYTLASRRGSPVLA